jgi:hypothetical protein
MLEITDVDVIGSFLYLTQPIQRQISVFSLEMDNDIEFDFPQLIFNLNEEGV